MPGMLNTNRLHQHNSDLALFIGKEMEGPHTGELTLFVKNKVPQESILAALNPACRRIYFGAGMMSSFDVVTVNKFLLLGYQCTVEGVGASLLQELPDDVDLTIHYSVYVAGISDHLTEVNRNLTFDKATVYYKVDTGRTCLFFSTPPTSLNTFDGYPDDILLYYKEIT